MERYCVYKHTAPNGKVYIGITSMQPVKRWNNGFGYSSNRYFWFDIVQFGWKNIKHEILFNGISCEEAERLEAELIQKHKSDDFEFGYNIDSGGIRGCKHPESTKIIMSLSRRGAKNHNSKAVMCIETGEVFESTGEASRAKKINRGHISQVCLGNRKTAGKFHWKHIE